ncbi:LytR/AlgR family response regulator transcription factor [Flagellimonas sp. GZD32]|uniref:LytR/AlgR family response regulator transcription factor n=1 Tax=Flagellimonas cixiensis TaxID=3228750 RepID=UPI0035C88756
MNKVKLLIVEDEIILAQDIANRLTDLNYHIVGVVGTAKGALDFISENRDIDLILLDIILKGDLDGIELGRMINRTYQIPFIFLTSHADTHIVNRAKSVLPYAYILKPFNDRQVSVAIELALMNFSKKTPLSKITSHPGFSNTENEVMQMKDCLFLKKDHHFERVPLREILFLEADSNYCTIHTKTARFVYSVVLKKVEAILPVNRFLRTHRSYVVNINSVNGFEGNMLFIGENKIPVSKAHRQDVFRLFPTL